LQALARVRGVMRSSTSSRSMLYVVGSISQKTIFAPTRANADAVATNVYDGTITSSPGSRSSTSAATSSAPVQLCVRSTCGAPVYCESHACTFLLCSRLPPKPPLAKTRSMYSRSFPAMNGSLKLIVMGATGREAYQRAEERQGPALDGAPGRLGTVARARRNARSL
jgi:hypothetical protein